MEDWINAGKIAGECLNYGCDIAKPGITLLELAEKIEGRIKELGAKPAFPVNLSLNSMAAHYTPSADDKTVFGDEDITNNPTIKVRTYFGEREDALVKVIEGQLDLRIKGFDIIDYAPHIIILLLILLIIGAMRKKKCEHCGHKNPRKRKICKNCHNKL